MRSLSGQDYSKDADNLAHAYIDYTDADSSFPLPLWVKPSALSSKDEQERLYFQSFQEDLVPRFQGAFIISSFWKDLLTEAIQMEPALRYVAIAIAALQRAFDTPTELSCRWIYAEGGGEAFGHYEFALRYYQEAISFLKSNTSVRTALVASLLFSSFETLHGRPDLAISTVKSGFKLLRNLRSHFGGPKSLLVACVGENLIQVFGRLCIQVMPYAGIQDMSFYNVLCKKNFDNGIPTAFSSIEEARLTLESIILQELSGQIPRDSWGDKAVISDMATLEHATGAAMAPFANPAARALLELCISDSMRWSRAFEPFVKSLSNTISPEDFTNIIALQLHCKSTAILLACALVTTESSFDAFLPDFQEIVHLCKLQLSQPSFAKPALFVSYGVNLPLFITASKCRHHATRHQAISLLQETRRNEGIWNGALAAAIGAWIAGLEERQGEDEALAEHRGQWGAFIPEERRVRLSRLALDYKLKQAIVVCIFVKKTPNGEPIQADTNFTWD